MLTHEEALVRKLDHMAFVLEEQEHVEEEREVPSKPLALRFYFIEICRGAGKLSKFLIEMGWQVGLIIDLDRPVVLDFPNFMLLSASQVLPVRVDFQGVAAVYCAATIG